MIGAEAFADGAKRNRRASELMMQPKPYNAALLPAPERTAVELKHDGLAFLWVEREALTRAGVPFDCSSHLLPAVDDLERILGGNYVLQGEFVEPAGVEAASASFVRGSSRTGILYIFDAVPLQAWIGAEHSPSLEQRRRLLEAAFQIFREKWGDKCGVYLGRIAVGFDQEGVELAAGEAWADGGEGIVVKDLDSPYVRDKSHFWMKVKRVQSVDVPVQAVALEADGKTLRNLIVTFDGRPVKVPVGFSDDQRRNAGDFPCGRLVEIAHNGVTRAGMLKSPRFVRFRDDKERK